jgi:hypothetical protein
MSTSYVHGEHDQVHHSGRNTLGQSLKAGSSYRLSQPGKVSIDVMVDEDPSTGDLYFKIKGKSDSMQRVEECSIDCTFSEIVGDGNVDEVLHASITEQLSRALAARQELAIAEQLICNLLGCDVGDLSEVSDAVTTAVRDGMGSAFDLVQMRTSVAS